MISKTLLKRARARISKESRWCKGAWGTHPKGRLLQEYEIEDKHSIAYVEPVRLCAIGSIIHVGRVRLEYRSRTVHDTVQFMHSCAREKMRVKSRGAIYFNDRAKTTHKDVMELFDYALRRLEEAVSDKQKPDKTSPRHDKSQA